MHDAMSPQPTTCDVSPALADLVGYLSGLRDRADLGVLERMLKDLHITREDIAPACVFGARGYRRNTIAQGEWFELLALCWRSGDCTPIHDHEGSSCAFKVIEGQGTEIRYERTASGLVCPTGRVMLDEGTVCAAADGDIHQVANMQAKDVDLITLHIYSPASRQMGTYDFASGEPAESP